MTVPNALEVLRQVRQALGDRVLLGAGTVLDPETARAVLLAGAEFVVAPTLNLDVIRLCRRYDRLVMPGAFTPTEILTAWEAGADIVKVFPAEVVGPAFFKALRGPLAAGAADAHRRRGPDHGGRLPQGRGLLPGRRRAAGRARGGRRAQLRPHPRPGPAVRRPSSNGIAARGPPARQARKRGRAAPPREAFSEEPCLTTSSPLARPWSASARRTSAGWSKPGASTVQVGGAELNTAVGLARLGRSAAWVSRLTDNPLGRLIANHAREAGVATEHVVWTEEDRVGLYFLEFGAAPRQQRRSTTARGRPSPASGRAWCPGGRSSPAPAGSTSPASRPP